MDALASRNTTVPKQTWQFPIENGTVVVRPDVPSLFCLNHTATAIWAIYQQTGSHDRAADLLVERFGISRELAMQDVTSTVNGWADTGLLGVPEGDSTPLWNGEHGPAIVFAHCCIEGTTFMLLTDSPEVVEEVAPRLSSVTVTASAPDVTIAVWASVDGFFAIAAGDQLIAMEQGVRKARAVLFQELVCRARPGRAWLALLHAGACGLDGRCVLFPAASYSGKSTLAAALMASGFRVYSDDFVGLEANGFRIPIMPFAIAVRRGSWDVLRRRIPQWEDSKPLEGFGEQIKLLPVPPASEMAGEAVALVFSKWVAGADVAVRRLTTVEAIGRLNESGFWVAPQQASIGLFLAWLDQLPKFALQYGDLSDAIEQVTAMTSPELVVDCSA